jgi:hypothetical protein
MATDADGIKSSGSSLTLRSVTNSLWIFNTN